MTIVLEVNINMLYFTVDTNLFVLIKLKRMGRAPDLSRMNGHKMIKSVQCITCDANWQTPSSKSTYTLIRSELVAGHSWQFNKNVIFYAIN